MSKVYIIGTGPGDEELLTVKAVRCLKECTAVLYDRLVSNNILNYVNDNCEVYYCGKEPGMHYKTQEQINELIVELAKKGHIVGRVKGGDPYVFGRGSEEVLALKKENIDYEVIPGITSPISVLNYAGIPITHRGVSQSFHIVTGKSAASLNVNFEALAKETGTLVFMMGLSNLSNIVRSLIENGKDINTPCAVVMRGTSSKQKKVVGTLIDIEIKVEEAKLKSPCIIVVGEVVNLNEDLDWYETKPLFGKNIALLRTKNQGSELKAKLKELGAEVTNFHSIEIKDTSYNLDDYLEKIKEYDHIIFTSVNSVNIFFDYLINKKYDIRRIKAEIYSMGNATKNELNKRGIITYDSGNASTSKLLFEAVKDNIKENDKILLPCSSLSKPNLYDSLKKMQAQIDKVFIYDTVCGNIKDTRPFEDVDIVLFTSPSTVNNMIKIIGADKIREKTVVAIGPVTAKALNENNIECIVCEKQNDEGFIDKILNITEN